MRTEGRGPVMLFIPGFLSLLIAFYTIVFHIGFTVLPVFFLCLSILMAFFPRGIGTRLFLVLVPLVNSLPAFFFNGYAFNLMGTLLFLLSGLVIGHCLKGECPDLRGSGWYRAYSAFLALLWVSAFFVFLRWSNLTITLSAFFSDTPVSPGIPDPPRVSFAVIFPVMTLFLFSVTPFAAGLLRKHRIGKDQAFKLLVSGYTLSFLTACVQKFFDNGFMAMEWWGSRMKQYNGGSSDFNGFGFFGGVIFLYSSLKIIRNSLEGRGPLVSRHERYLLFPFFISFFGIILSGSRTAFVFILVSLLFLVFSRVGLLFKLVVPVLMAVLLFVSGGNLLNRLDQSVSPDVQEKKDLLTTLDEISNGRVTMIVNSIPMIREYPVTGVGAGNFLFYLKYLKYGEEFLEDLPLNQYLLIADETGMAGLAFFLFFLYSALNGMRRDIPFRVMSVILLVMMVGNSLWLPEVFILFWLILGFLEPTGKERVKVPTGIKWAGAAAAGLFVLFNIFSAGGLHPSDMMRSRGLPYDYGFWKESRDAGFQWTREEAGILMEADENGQCGPLKVFCGAPLEHLPGNAQEVRLFVNGAPAGEKRFTANGEHIFFIKDEPRKRFFLRIKTDPVFNLKKMGLGEESRDLGVQFFPAAPGSRLNNKLNSLLLTILPHLHFGKIHD